LLDPTVLNPHAPAEAHQTKISAIRIEKLLEPSDPAAENDPRKFLREAFDAPYFGNTRHQRGEMSSYVLNDMKFSEDAKQNEQLRAAVVAALSAEARLPAQAKLEATADGQKLIATGRELLESAEHCAGCHNFRGPVDWSKKADDYPDLEGYGSREWLTELIANPAHPRFYHNNNDRMPAFAENREGDRGNVLTRRELALLVAWLRGETELLGD
jgi:mono/diheme cytochrome c family protein